MKIYVALVRLAGMEREGDVAKGEMNAGLPEYAGASFHICWFWQKEQIGHAGDPAHETSFSLCGVPHLFRSDNTE
jgi:hypothetical protein